MCARSPNGWPQSSGLILWDVEMKGAGAVRTLRIFIDRRPEGVTHEDCSEFSREVATIFRRGRRGAGRAVRAGG